MGRFIKMLQAVSRIGTADITSETERHQVTLVNWFVVGGICGITSYNILIAAMDWRTFLPQILVTSLIIIPLFLIVLVLNGRKHYLAAKTLLILMATVNTLVSMVTMGPHSGIEIEFFLIVIGAMLVYSQHQIRYMIAIGVLNLACYLAAEFYFNQHHLVEIPERTAVFSQIFAVFSTFLIFFIYFLYHQRMIARYEAKSQQHTEQLAELALADPLTGVKNRRFFFAELEKEMNRSRRTSTPLALIVLDIDHFKKINDNHGHLTGDRALKHLTELIITVIRPYDLFCRIGGEEFTVIIPHADLAKGVIVAERIRKTISEKHFTLPDSAAPFTVSIGLAVYVEPESMDEFFNRADQALYRAKQKGRNRVEIAEV